MNYGNYTTLYCNTVRLYNLQYNPLVWGVPVCVRVLIHDIPFSIVFDVVTGISIVEDTDSILQIFFAVRELNTLQTILPCCNCACEGISNKHTKISH